MDCDVIVIGGGGAGMSAAWHAASAGASVMLLEAADKPGGATALSTGVVYAAGTSVQAAAGIQDSAEGMYAYMMTLNQWSLRPSLVRVLSEGGKTLIDWLTELGNEFPPDWVVRSGVDEIPRGHQSIGAGIGIAQSLVNAIGAKEVQVVRNARVESLLREDGRVVGVRAAGTELRGRAVILTTGGFGNNPALIDRLYPTAAAHGERVYSVYMDAPFNMGDGILLGEGVGGNVVGIDNGLLNPTPNFSRAIEAFLPDWAMVVNRDGRRFLPETSPYAISGYLINEQPEKRCFAIFDETTLNEAAGDDKIVKHYENDPGSESWRASAIRKNVEIGRVKTADTIAELARRADISVAGLEAAVARYNENCERGEDSDFFKKVSKFYPILKPPFYAVEVRANLIGSTHAGLDINERGCVLDRTGRPIPGLYAGGEVLGCTLGRRYIGGGIGIANALTFGRLAGRCATEDLDTRP